MNGGVNVKVMESEIREVCLNHAGSLALSVERP